jgi:hypothetical protein
MPIVPGQTATNFIARCLRGEVAPAGIVDEIVRWNDGDRRVPIHTFLGMNDAEWALYMQAESNLERILQERRTRHLHRPQPAVRGRRF